MRIATSAYALGWLDSWADYAAKLGDWVARAAAEGAELAVFPEYAAMELAALSGEAQAADLRGSIEAVAARMDDAWDLQSELATRHDLHLLAGSGPVIEGDRVVNRAVLLTPGGGRGVQDKQVMTRFEREDWGVSGGGPLRLFETALGRIGVLICYDVEFPLLGRALSDADLLLVPSCTEAAAGYHRVRIGAQARALENQCVAVMSSLVGEEPRLFAVEENTGAGGIFGPPDRGFPESGVMAAGRMAEPGWTVAEVDLAAVEEVRRDGVVLNRSHWDDQTGRDGAPELVRL